MGTDCAVMAGWVLGSGVWGFGLGLFGQVSRPNGHNMQQPKAYVH